MARAGFRTDYRLWVLAGTILFVALGFVDPVAGVAKGDNCLWAYVATFVTGNYSCSTAEIVATILFRSALQAIPAAAIGWVVQAVTAVARTAGRSAESSSEVAGGR